MNFQDVQTIQDLEKIYPQHVLDRFPIASRNIYKDISDTDWYSWKWQLQNRIENMDQLSKVIQVTEDEKNAFSISIEKFKMSITPYFGSLMDNTDPNCPVRMQSVPSLGELNILPTDLEDPLGEDKNMPVPGLTHRYPDRVLFYVSHDCPMLCRHCTRKRKVANPCMISAAKNLELGFKYIEEHPEVRDVIVSGGDPLVLSNDKIEYILKRLRAIKHIEVIRLGTRNPVTLPFRLLDDELLTILQKYQPIYVNTHYNHPKEITREALLACTRLALAGAITNNQSVLLKGINDNSEIMTKLAHLLLMMRVRPYYLYQCDLSEGISHFRTSVFTGVDIIEKMRGWTSGLAIPQFVVDAPGGGGKIPLNPDYFVKKEENKITLRNYKNEEYVYFGPTEE